MSALGLEKELGTIEEGKLADLLVVDGNPLDDVDLLLQPASIRVVLQGGRIVKSNPKEEEVG